MIFCGWNAHLRDKASGGKVGDRSKLQNETRISHLWAVVKHDEFSAEVSTELLSSKIGLPVHLQRPMLSSFQGFLLILENKRNPLVPDQVCTVAVAALPHPFLPAT
ncbi:hypothetical protein TNCT_151131 [Trichonephila clavata]|uniref:Uncharacterized protein n=1 Tax=Trichonephila clavata TaxID=2740835 RepID=A0A8X6M6N2_TRICU|nr:hypothetical protein TNCT_151131 [Trichonephila clavata]